MVDDVRPYIEQASLVLNYVESGGGIALKVLEAMAMRKAVLSNPLGCEGINVEHGKHVFLANGADAFAEAAVTLLSDKELRTNLAKQGYDLVQRRYAWNAIANEFTACYTELLECTSGTLVTDGVVTAD
jgi:glycosyltransferase involved in cell wall biosynthesis